MLALRLSRRLVVPRAIPRTRWASTAALGAALRGLKSLNADDLAHFSKILPASSIISTLPPVKSAASELDIYNDDWMGKYHGQSTTVLKPKTTQQVADIVRWCNEKRIGLVPQGGNTGLVGGSIPLKDELIISLANMNQVRSFDPISGV